MNASTLAVSSFRSTIEATSICLCSAREGAELAHCARCGAADVSCVLGHRACKVDHDSAHARNEGGVDNALIEFCETRVHGQAPGLR